MTRSASHPPAAQGDRVSGVEAAISIETSEGFASAAADLLPVVRGVARRLDPRNWEDLTQETLTRAWRARAQFQPGTSLKAWLLTILRNVFKSGVRTTNHQVAWEEYFGDRLTQAPDQEAILLDADLSAALASLKADQRAALLCVTDGNLSYADAAKRLGITMATLKTRIFRARRSVMTFLDEGRFERAAFMPIAATA